MMDDLLDRKADYPELYIVVEVDRPGGAPDEDQHICLMPSAEAARDCGAELYDHFRVFRLEEVSDAG